jgi:hypothetical protein
MVAAQAMPMIPVLLRAAAAVCATRLPWSLSLFSKPRDPATSADVAATRPANSGELLSIPESITAIVTP